MSFFQFQNPFAVGRNINSTNMRIPGCAVYETTNQSITFNTTTALTFSFESFDRGGMHDISVNPSRIYILRAGVYIVTGRIAWASNATGTYREFGLRQNGSAQIDVQNVLPSSVFAPCQVIASAHLFSAGDYIELTVFHDSNPGPENVLNATAAGRFAALWIGA